MRHLIRSLGRARSPSGDLAFVAVWLVLLPGLAILGLALVATAVFAPPAALVLPVFLFPLGGCAVAGGVLLLFAAREQARLARNQAAYVAQKAHDIRTPLATLRLMLEGRAAGEGEEVRAAGRAALAALERQVDELLEWGRLAAGRPAYRLRPVVPDRVVERSVLQVRGVTARRRQEIVVLGEAGGEELLADEEALAGALANLLSNASKFSPEGSTIELEVRARPEEVRFLVSDRGPGVPPAEREKIFRMFYRGQAAAAREGVGLGLAIVAEVARSHGGSVSVGPRPGGGARFTLSVPTRRALEGVA